MTKKGPLGKAEEFYVEHHFDKLSVDEIAKELDRAKATIKKKVEKLQKEVQPFNAGSQMARQEGVTIMTENASSMSDESKKPSGNTRTRKCVTKIKR
tara:strand:- start:3622 stop:3912 length:291 start_codon:yes stop_codon:yes gene_type:complete